MANAPSSRLTTGACAAASPPEEACLHGCTPGVMGLSVFLEARREIADHPSVAEDTGAPARTTKHFLQRVLNKYTGAQELGPVLDFKGTWVSKL